MSAEVLCYSVLFLVGAPANIIVLRKLLQNNSYKRSRHLFLLLNLCLADAIVVFVMIPVEISYKHAGVWQVGNVACKVSKFLQAFGTYSSSLLLISVSVDRYHAVVKPFAYAFLDRKINLLLLGIWIFSFAIATPQVSEICQRETVRHTSKRIKSPNVVPCPFWRTLSINPDSAFLVKQTCRCCLGRQLRCC